MWTAELAYAKARAGARAGALALLSELIERSRHTFVSPYDLAIAFAGLGDDAYALDLPAHAVTPIPHSVLSRPASSSFFRRAMILAREHANAKAQWRRSPTSNKRLRGKPSTMPPPINSTRRYPCAKP